MPDTLAQKIRAKYPGAYDDLDDQALESAVKAKFPGAYDDVPTTKVAAPAAPAKAIGQSPLSALGIEVVDQGVWDAMSPKERLQGLLKAAGYGISGMLGMGDSGRQAVDNPGSTLASAAVGGVGPIAAKATAPYIAPAARATASALQSPLVSGGVGAVTGYQQGGVMGGIIGAATGGTAGPRVARELNKFANKIAPLPARMNAGQNASRQMVAGMSSRPATAAAPPVAAPVAPPPVAPAPQAVPVARVSAAPPTAASSPALPAMSPQRIQNELGLASRRANLKLTEPQYAEAAQLVKQGHPPMDAVRQVSGGQAAPAAAPAVPAAVKAKLTAAETKEYVRLRSAGKSHQQAAEALEAQRTLMQKLGTPSPEQARQAVATRNSTGRWRR